MSPPSPPDTTPTIREAVSTDLEVIVEFNRRLAHETEVKTLDLAVLRAGVTMALADPDRLRYFVAETGQPPRIVGQLAVTREWSDWRLGWIWWIQSVYVDSDARRQGVFRSLFQHIRDQARARPDVIGLRLYVEDANADAHRTYQAMGMKPGGYSVYEDFWTR